MLRPFARCLILDSKFRAQIICCLELTVRQSARREKPSWARVEWKPVEIDAVDRLLILIVIWALGLATLPALDGFIHLPLFFALVMLAIDVLHERRF